MSRHRRQAAEGQLGPGSVLRVERTFTTRDVEQFGDQTRDYNPVHYDKRWCQLKGYRAPVCHGLLVGSMVCQPGGQVGWLATGMSFRFRRPVYVGDTVSCELTITAVDGRGKAQGECVMRNQDGVTVVTGTLEGYLPGAPERRLLATMLAEGDPDNGIRD